MLASGELSTSHYSVPLSGCQGCVSLRFKGLPQGYRWGFPYLKNSKNCTKNLNIFFTSRWPGAKSAPVHQLAKKLYLRTWGHFKDRTPPPRASKNGEFPDFRLSETHPCLYYPRTIIVYPYRDVSFLNPDNTSQ